MKLNELKPSVPKKARKRVGRGESSGLEKQLVREVTDKIQDLVEE